MNKKLTLFVTILMVATLSCFFLTTCNVPAPDKYDALPLEEWEVTRVEYNPTWRVPYVSVFVTGDLSYGYYNPDDREWSLSSLVSIPGLELGGFGKSSELRWAVTQRTAADGVPLTAYFKHDIFIKREGEFWDQKDVARVRIKTESVPVTIIEIK